ncbi:4Fe-4S single cluster domain-containing protein [Ramlibacter humi]|uniref:Radical SAM protein n=1 Tax=Ramlibacter humi TaxID=2530451 RepID=A0A4Z0CEP2_9BURK|nr:4Fe-4S single cluster domain-containing protein [Ramlibacter humi]TFZ08945.1 radical SAM protein [Ramlibacter humi]
MHISLSRAHFPVTTLGPGRRVGIWLQGCSIRCPGCISSDTWATKAPQTTVRELLERVHPWLQECDGVTISGGEPFEQPDALEQLLRGVRALTATSVLVYSGKSFAQLTQEPSVREGLIDCLISEPFDQSAPQTKYLMGSDNQRMNLLTPLGREVFGPLIRVSGDADRRLDVMFDEDGAVWLAGIPSRGDMARLQLLLEGEGTYLRTTEARA